VVAVVLAACQSPSSPSSTAAPTAKLFLPADGGTTVVVLVPGGSWRTADPAGLEPLARELSRAGYVAATSTYRAAAAGAHFPTPVADVLCAAASAVTQAAATGRGGGPLVLLGHSAGGQLALLAALRPAGFRSDCADPPVTPDAVVALAGAFDLAGIGADLFGVQQAARPELWQEGDVHTWVRERPQLPVLLVHGLDDPLIPPATTSRLSGELRAAGHSVRTELLPGATHDSVYRPGPVLPVLLSWLSTLRRQDQSLRSVRPQALSIATPTVEARKPDEGMPAWS
jgi:acetyl esterase/lipase